jgi:hypothetical protein
MKWLRIVPCFLGVHAQTGAKNTLWACVYVYCFLPDIGTRNTLLRNIGIQGFPFHVKWVPCHHGMARRQVADGGDGLQIWRVAANISNKQSRTADRGSPPAWGLGGRLTTPHRKNSNLLRNNITEDWLGGGGGVLRGFTWLRMGTLVGLSWMRWWTFGFWRHGVS